MHRSLLIITLALVFAAAVAASPVVTRFPNGLTLVAESRPGAPVTAIQVWVRCGSADETDRLAGISHFLEHMLFKGTDSRPVGAVHREIETHGGEINAATSDDWTYYHVTMPAAEWRRGLDVLLDAARNSSLPAGEVEREREVVQEEIARRLDQPEQRLNDLVSAAAFQRHPYRRPTIGYETTVAALTREDLRNWYRGHYTPDRMAVVVIGDFDTAVLHREVARTLGRDPRSRWPPAARPGEPHTVAAAVEATMPVALVYGATLYPAPAASQLREVAAADVLAEMLTAPGFGRLRRRLVEEEKLADEISAWFPTARDASRFAVTFVTSPEKRLPVTEAIRREMTRLRHEDAGWEEVRAAADRLQNALRRRRESAEAVAFDLGFWFAMGRIESADGYEKMLGEITPADLRQFARKHLADTWVVEGAILPPPPAETAAATIIRQPARTSQGAVGVFLAGGQAVEPRPGWSALLAGILNRGEAGRAYADYQRELERLGLALGASSHEDMIYLSGSAEVDRLPLALDRLAAIIESPNFADLDLVRDELKARLRARADQPFEFALQALVAARFGDHPYGRPPEGDDTSLAAANPEELRAFLQSLLAEGNLRLVVIGDSAAALAAAAFRERLVRPGPAPVAPALNPEAGAGERRLQAVTGQTICFRSTPAPAIGDPGYPQWKAANAILGGRSSSRLFRQVREEKGLAYSVGSFYPSRGLGSQLVCYAGTRPENETTVRQLFLAALRQPPTAAELAEAKAMITGDFALEHELSERRAWYLGWFASLGLEPGFDARYPELINRVTLPEVEAVFATLAETPPLELMYGGAP